MPKANSIVLKSLEELSKLNDRLKDIDRELTKLRSERENVVNSIKLIKDDSEEDIGRKDKSQPTKYVVYSVFRIQVIVF